MKIKLTPELSYLIGLWSKKRCPEGIGINGNGDYQQIFAQCVLELKLVESNMLLSDDAKIYFYHTKYRRFFQEIEENKLERYKYLNEYSANYLAGIFDAIGEINEQGMVYLKMFGKIDEVLLLRLGFPTKKINEKLVIKKPKVFLAFIKNYTRVFSNNPVMKIIKF